MFDSPGSRTASAETEKSTPQAAPSSAFVPGNTWIFTPGRARSSASGQFELTTTRRAFRSFAARFALWDPRTTFPVSTATLRARASSITSRPPVSRSGGTRGSRPPSPASPAGRRSRSPRPRRVRPRLGRIRVRELEDLCEVRALRVDHVPFPPPPDDRAPDPLDPLDPGRLHLFEDLLELLERRLPGLDDEPLHVLCRPPDGPFQFLRGREPTELLLQLRVRHAAGLHPVVVREDQDLHVHEVRLDVRDVLEVRHLDLLGDPPHLVEVLRPLFDVDLHDRRRGHPPSVHDLDQPRKAQGDVHLRDPGVVERPHRHLCPGLTNRLRGYDPRALVRVDPVGLVAVRDAGEELQQFLAAYLDPVHLRRELRDEGSWKIPSDLLEGLVDLLLALRQGGRLLRDLGERLRLLGGRGSSRLRPDLRGPLRRRFRRGQPRLRGDRPALLGQAGRVLLPPGLFSADP